MSRENREVRFGLVFILLALAVSAPFYTLGPRPLFPPSWNQHIPLSALMTVVPMSVAIALSYAEGGWKAPRELFRGVLAFHRIKPVWYLPVLLLVPAAAVLSYITLTLMGTQLPGFTPLSNAVFSLLPLFIFAIGEEIGWTAYLAPRLQSKWGALNVALFIGVVCVLWHLVPYMVAGRSAIWIVGQSCTILAKRVVMVWLYNNTGRTVLAPVLFHVMMNVSYQMFPYNGSHYDPITTAVFEVLFATIIVFVWGPKTLAHSRFVRPDLVATAG